MNRSIPPIMTMAALACVIWSVPMYVAFGQTMPSDALKMKAVDRIEQTLVPPRGARRMALCIGIDHYQSAGYSPLTCAVADAKDLGVGLKQLGYDVTVMTDDATDEKLRPTFDNMSSQLRKFTSSASNPNDTLIISFSGHGDKVGGQTGLLPLDYGPQHHDLITLGVVMDNLSKLDCRARKKLLILDACRSAAEKPERRQSSGFLQSLGNPESFLVLTGCGENQSSVEDPNLGHGRLTATLLEGLEGKAFVKDKDSLLVEQLTSYVQSTFRDRGWATTQSPEVFGRLTAVVGFELARRNLPKPPPLTRYDRLMLTRALQDARQAWQEYNYPDAIDAATTALKIDEKNADAFAERALALQSLGYPDKADSDASLALDIDPQQMLASYVLGMSLSDKDDEPSQRSGLARLQKVTEAVDADPSRWPILAHGELALLRLGQIESILARVERRYPAALIYFTRVIEIKDAPAEQVAWGLVSRGITYRKMGQPENEVADCTRVIDMKDAPAEQIAFALVNRGDAYRNMGQPEKEVADCTRVIEMKDVSSVPMALALVNRGDAYGRMGQPQKAVADCTSVIAMKDAPTAQVALALVNRGAAYGRMRHPEKAVADCTSVIEMKDAPIAQVAMALVNRGTVYGQMGQPEKEMADCTRVIEMKDAPAEQAAKALVNRGAVYERMGRPQMEVADCTRAIEMKDAPAEQVARALVNRGSAYEQMGQAEKGVSDYTRAIEMKDAPAEQVARALVNRGEDYRKMGQPEKEVADCTHVIEMKNAPVDQVAMALVNRGAAYGLKGQPEQEIADWTRVIEMKDAPAEQVAMALVNRGTAYELMGQLEKEVADDTRVIGMKDAPAAQVAKALVNRGDDYGKMGQPEKELADYIRVIEMQDAPPEEVASALVGRGWASYQQGKLAPALEDSRKALELDARNHDAAFNIGLILLRQGKLAEARKAYETAMAGGLETIADAIDDLVELRDKLKGPPETTAFLGWLRRQGADDSQGRQDIAAYLKAHPQGPLAGWANELLAAPATRPSAATRAAEKRSQ